MKSFREYLAESKKMYTFKVKVAGELPEGFVENLKKVLADKQASYVEKVNSTPIQSQPLDFPTLQNAEVTVFEVACEYPMNTQEMIERIKNLNLPESNFIVRTGSDAGEQDKAIFDIDPSKEQEPLLQTEGDKDQKIKHKDYFGSDFNKGFLKDLQKVSKDRKKDGQQAEYKIPAQKQDKAGIKSPMGS
jgi:hypothetical protein